MPLLTRWFIKTSFVYLGIALVVGILLGGNPSGARGCHLLLFSLAISI